MFILKDFAVTIVTLQHKFLLNESLTKSSGSNLDCKTGKKESWFDIQSSVIFDIINI